MKALLRASILTLVVAASYVAFASPGNGASKAGPWPTQIPGCPK